MTRIMMFLKIAMFTSQLVMAMVFSVAPAAAEGLFSPVLDNILLKEDFAVEGVRNTLWSKFGEGSVSDSNGVLQLVNAHVSSGDRLWKDYELEFQARVPADAEEAQIFASVRYNDDLSRYIVGLRGGNNNDLFIARYYKKHNQSRILKIAPLDFVVAKDVWYTVRVVVVGFRISVFLNDELIPRVTAADHGTPLTTGGIALGGGWNPVEFNHVQVKEAKEQTFPAGSFLYKFQNLEDPPVDGWQTVDGSLFSNSTNVGFTRESFTMKNDKPTGDRFYDTAVGIHEGRTNFFLELPDGDYLVTLQMGWNAEQVQSIVWFQDEEISSANEIVAKGDSHVIRKSVSVTNGNLNLEFLRTNGFSTYLNWMAIERREAVGEVTWNHFLAPPADTSEAKKRSSLHGRRSSYSGITISSISSARSEHSLNGDWLFLPLQEMIEGPKPWLPQADDSNWHVMDVPKFWTPLYAWTYMDEDQGRGSANWVEREKARCESYTFDYETTSVAFYKKHVTLPLDITGRTCFLTFDAIGKDAEVWVNGLPAGVHSGMFSAAKFDVTSFVRPGENIIVVKAGEFTDFDITNDFLPGVAERRPIEKKTSQNYPNGMLFGRNLGIWQGVMLTFSDDITIEDTFFRPGLNKYDLSVTVANRGASSTPYSLASQIRSFEDNRLIYDSYSFSRKFGLTMTSSSVQKFELFDNPLGHIPFRNWSPESPNLYKVDIFAYRYNQDPTVSLSEFSSPILKLNFQPADFPTPLGWTAAGGDSYNPTTGFGWNSVEETRVRSNATNPLSDTLITFYRDTEAIFSCDVPNGEYVLTMQFGDKEYPSLAEAYVGDDTSNLDAVIVRDAMDMNSFRIVLKSITVENGQLMITIPSMPDPAIGTSLNWLVLEPRSAVTAAKWELGLNHFDILDFHSYDVGFRTFTAIGDDFYLNGRPYKIRGANHLPNILRPNDAALADWFTKIIHDKNINFSRAHSAPMTDTWFKAANKNGVAISQEGTWPWLMHRGDTESIPPPEVLRLWLSEWLALVNQHKNHPSLLMWTMNNESKLHLLNHPTTWNVLSDAIKALRRIDPTRPIVADSGYARKFLEETGGLHAGTDDGDVDDVHKYYNWYDEETFFFLRDGVSFTVDKTPGRPFISQELSTGYPDADSGHPIKHYIYTHFSPQAWVGRWAYEDKDPQYFLERHAQITKETAEVLRSSYRESSAGVMMFALNSWFKNVYDVDSIEPWPTLEAVSMAHEPVMACLNLNTRNFYVGTEETVNAFVVNDSRDYEIFNDVVVNWQIIYQDRALSSGSMSFSGSLAYFENFSGRLTFSLPDSLPERKVNAVLRLRLHGNGRFLSTNEYKITVCDTIFAKPSSSMTVAYFGNDQDKLVSVMERAGISVVRLNSILEVSAATPGVWDVVVIGRMQERPIGYEGLLTFMSNGGHILFQDNGEQIMELFPSEIRAFQSRGREIVTPVDYGRSIFTDIDVMDLSWFNGSEDLPESPKEGFAPFAARGMYNVNYDDDDVLLLAEATAIHGYRSQVVSPDMFQITGVVESAEQNLDVYFPDMSYDQVHGYPLFKVRQGSGAAIVSSMLFEADKDPISNRLLINVLEYLKSKQEQAIVIDLTPVASTPAESTTPSLRVPSSAATCYGTGCGGGSYFYLSQLSSILMFVGLFVI